MLQTSLDDITVIDFTQIGAGPTCTMYLGDLGARVIKVEPPAGDIGRLLGPPWHGDTSAVFVAFNRNKESICIDLTNAEGKQVIWKLIEKADVIVESFRPGVMERFGLNYAEVKKRKKDIIYCSVSAYGQEGSYSKHAGVDGIIQAASGLMSLIGSKDGDPCKVQAPIVDVTTGYLATIAVLTALYRRKKTANGIHLDVNLFSSAIALQQSALTGYLTDSTVPEKLGSAAPYSAPNEAFPTQDGWIMVAAYSPERWEALCHTLQAPELLTNPLFSSSSLRVEHRDEMRQALATLFRQRTTAKWMDQLEAVDILCSPVRDYKSLMEHPQLHELGLISHIQATHPGAKDLKTPGFPVKASEEDKKHTYPPYFSEHAEDILAWVGYSTEQINALQQHGAIQISDT